MKYSIFLSLLLSVYYLGMSSSNAQVFHHFGEQDNGPVVPVLDITQDQDGFIWSATTTGLFRYDSRSFRKYTYNPDEPNSLPDTYAQSVYPDSRGELWVGTRKGLALYNKEMDGFISIGHDTSRTNSLSGNMVYSMLEDRKGRFWVGTSGGVDLLDRDGLTVVRKLPADFTGFSRRIRCMAEDKDGILWLGTYGGLIRFDPEKNEFRLFKRETAVKASLKDEYVAVYVDRENRLWLGSNFNGLVEFDVKSEVFKTQSYFTTSTGYLPIVNRIVEDETGVFWIATESGLARMDPRNRHEIRWFSNDPEDRRSLVDDVLYAIYQDRQKGIWLGSYYMGLSYVYPYAPEFEQWPPAKLGLGEDDFLNGWMGITESGAHWFVNYQRDKATVLDAKTGKVTVRKLSLHLPESYTAFYLDRQGILWCGGRTILCEVDLATGRMREYPVITSTGREVWVDNIFEKSSGELFITGGGGGWLFQFVPETHTLRQIEGINSVQIMYEDTRKNLWLGGTGKIFRLNADLSGFREFDNDTLERFGRNNHVHRIQEDATGQLWCATTEGLIVFDPDMERFVASPELQKVYSGSVTDVQPDRQGYLWLNIRDKLIRFHPEKGGAQVYGYREGLQANAILETGTSIKGPDGFLYFVTNKKMFRFDPEKAVFNGEPSSLVLLSTRLFGREMSVKEKSEVTKTSDSGHKTLFFRHDQNVFTLDFVLLSYVRSSYNTYSYKLEGFDSQWTETNLPSATYMNLPAGKFTFLVKAANGDGYWNPEPLRISIVVLPPWWKTWYAYFFYLLVVIGVVYWVGRFMWLKSAFRKENELYESKLNFFTNLSHEIRTHLLLISGPVEKALQASDEKGKVGGWLVRARDGSERLMQLVDELLDFRKIQSGSIRLQIGEYDIVGVIKNVTAAFEHLAEEKQISTNLVVPDSPVNLFFDLGQMQKVFYNLLSNAYKFSSEGGCVTIEVREDIDDVIVQIRDFGEGIAPRDLNKIFNSFFQTDEGNARYAGYGIGLALSREIVDRHQGKITVVSRLRTVEQHGETCFTIAMQKGGWFVEDPDCTVYQEPVRSDPGLVVGEKATISSEIAGLLPRGDQSILVIDDNDELRKFEVEIFSENYHVLEAGNGAEGLLLAQEHMPDLVVCDVMMPEMNGLEFCKKLKSDFRTRHIPVILVSARSAAGEMIEGLDTGADDYLIKPFDFRVLEVKIRNLILLREALKEQYSRSIILDKVEAEQRDPDAEFIARLRDLVTGNLTTPGFGVNEMAFHAGVSVSVLYRKLKALTGLTVNDFMKIIRMNSAEKLLASGRYHVGEVATIVGYEDAKYFSREFRKIMGKAPSEVRRSAHGTQEIPPVE